MVVALICALGPLLLASSCKRSAALPAPRPTLSLGHGKPKGERPKAYTWCCTQALSGAPMRLPNAGLWVDRVL